MTATDTRDALRNRAEVLGIDHAGRLDVWLDRWNRDQETVAPLSGFNPVRLDGLLDANPPALRFGPGVTAVRASGDPAVQRAAPTYTEVFERERVEGATGPLGGVTIAVKDLMEVRGRRVTAGTRAHHSRTADRDAPAVARLLEQGVRLVGMTNLHALAYGATGLSSDWGVPVNPQSPGGLPGGSSSGSAVAVAEESVDLALGTDTGGSIRIPAALCGVVGFKPTVAAVSTVGVHPLCPTLDHVGPMGRDVVMVAAAFDALVGAPPGTSSATAVEGTLSVGVLGGYFTEVLADGVRDCLTQALRLLATADVELQDVTLPLASLSPAAQLVTMATEALHSNIETLRHRAEQLPDDVRLRLEAGLGRRPEEYQLAQLYRVALRSQIDAALTRHHVLLCPTVLASPLPIDQQTVEVDGQKLEAQFVVTKLTLPFNLSGHPAVSLPFQQQGSSLAMGIQVIGRQGADMDLLRIGAHLEKIWGGQEAG